MCSPDEAEGIRRDVVLRDLACLRRGRIRIRGQHKRLGEDTWEAVHGAPGCICGVCRGALPVRNDPRHRHEQ